MRKPSKNVQDSFYRNLYENYEELSGFLRSAMDDLDRNTEEMRYLYDFIRHKIRVTSNTKKLSVGLFHCFISPAWH